MSEINESIKPSFRERLPTFSDATISDVVQSHMCGVWLPDPFGGSFRPMVQFVRVTNSGRERLEGKEVKREGDRVDGSEGQV